DWSTFTFGEIDLAGQSMKELAGRQRGEVVIPLKGRTDFVKAVLTFKDGHVQLYLRSYDKERARSGYWPEDDYDGILKPNDDTGRGEGHFTYRVYVKSSDALAASAEARVIHASAEIVFDENEMIPTDPAWYNTIYTEKPLTVVETAVEDGAEIPLETKSLSWTAGGGATSYDVTFWQLDGAGNRVGEWSVTDVEGTSCALPMELKGGASYQWRITSKNEFGATEGAVRSFTVTLDADALQVFPGWNLVTVTRELDADSETALLKQRPFAFDPDKAMYVTVRASWPGMPLWLFARQTDTVRFSGETLEDWALVKPVGYGWHLMGIVSDNAIPSWAYNIWEWDGERFVEPSSTELLKKGRAYWIFLPEPEE
ncbi:MAG: hypothetical protein IJT83_02325, partial [Victivallales bacterium]|nr:hypothetical protein [Victivallales bacterium]